MSYSRFGDQFAQIPPGALGVYRYLHKTNVGLQQLMALCRKYRVSMLSQEDLLPLTDEVARITGIPFAPDQDWDEVEEFLVETCGKSDTS